MIRMLCEVAGSGAESMPLVERLTNVGKEFGI